MQWLIAAFSNQFHQKSDLGRKAGQKILLFSDLRREEE